MRTYSEIQRDYDLWHSNLLSHCWFAKSNLTSKPRHALGWQWNSGNVIMLRGNKKLSLMRYSVSFLSYTNASSFSHICKRQRHAQHSLQAKLSINSWKYNSRM